MPATPPTELTMEQMRELVRADDLRIMTEAANQQNVKMKPMDDFLKGKVLKDFKTKLDELAAEYIDDVTLTQKINAVRMAVSLFN